MKTTRPIFVIGSGRCGTRSVYKLLRDQPDMEVHHEYACTHIQKLSVLKSLGKLDHTGALEQLNALHFSAIELSTSSTFIDCSNKLTWIIPELIERFPQARFVHMVRDGRKVSASFYRKLRNEIYDDESVSVLRQWLAGEIRLPPPPEKRYWWNIPTEGMPFAEVFGRFSQFERICYHWVESNRRILDDAETFLPQSQYLQVKLEKLHSDIDYFSQFLEFVGVSLTSELWARIQRPENAIIPMDFGLSPAQLESFELIASEMMHNLGYDLRIAPAEVNYGQ